jgi:hypothetical protein
MTRGLTGVRSRSLAMNEGIRVDSGAELAFCDCPWLPERWLPIHLK